MDDGRERRRWRRGWGTEPQFVDAHTVAALRGAKTTRPLAAVAAPSNLPAMLRVEAMETQLNASLAASKTPTQSAWSGAKTTSPLPAVATPQNLESMLSVEAMETQLNALLVGLKTPTQSALPGAKTTRPLPAVAAP